jgi:hypothetical protein
VNPIDASATAAIVSSLIALGALILSIYNYRRAKTEPGRVRQREIRDALRAILEPAHAALCELKTSSDAGRPLSAPTAELLTNHRLVRSLADRRAEILDQTRTGSVSVSLMLVGNKWDIAHRAQGRADEATARLKEKLDMGPEATMDTVERARTVQREKDHALESAKSSLREEAAKAMHDVGEEIRRLDTFDRGTD